MSTNEDDVEIRTQIGLLALIMLVDEMGGEVELHTDKLKSYMDGAKRVGIAFDGGITKLAIVEEEETDEDKN